MKTKSVLLAVMMSASVVFASEPGNFKVSILNQKESGIFKLIYEGEKSGNVKLNILDDAGVVIYRETIKDVASFTRPINFNGMNYGEYTIELVDNSGKKVQKVTYSNATAVNNVRITKTGEEGKYLLSVMNEGSDKVNVKIYDGASELVHDQTMTINGNYGVVYNLQKISGEPTFTITDNSGIEKIIK